MEVACGLCHSTAPQYGARAPADPPRSPPQGKRRMRASGRLAARVLQYAGSLVRPGITTDEIDKAVHAMIVENGAYPSPLNYGAASGRGAG